MNGEGEGGNDARPSWLDRVHGKAVLLFSIAASVWAGVTGAIDFWRDYLAELEAERVAQNQAVADVSRVLGIMRFNCDSSFGPLVRLADKASDATVPEGRKKQQEVCHGAFLGLSSSFYHASIAIERPEDVDEATWEGEWKSFADGIAQIATNDYVADRVDCPWKRIAKRKNALLHAATCPEGM